MKIEKNGLEETPPVMEILIIIGTYEKNICGIKFIVEKSNEGIKIVEDKNVFSTQVHSSKITALSVNKERTLLVSGGEDEVVNIFNLSKLRHIGTISHHEGTINDLCISGKYLFIAGSGRSIPITRTSSWECVHAIPGHKKGIEKFSVQHEGRIGIGVSGDKRTIKCWDLSSAKTIYEEKLQQEQAGSFVSLKWSPCKEVYCVLFERGFSVYDIQDSKYTFDYLFADRLVCVELYKENYMFIGTERGSLLVCNLNTKEVFEYTKMHIKRIKDILIIDVDGSDILFTASTEGTINAWELSKLIMQEDSQLYECRTSLRIIAMT